MARVHREAHHAQRRPERHDGGAVAALALAAAALAVAGVVLVLPTVRSRDTVRPDEGASVAPGLAGSVAVSATAGASPTAPTSAPASAPAPVSASAPPPAPAPAPAPSTGAGAAADPASAAPAPGAAPLDLGACLRTGVADVADAQADLDAGCTVELAYGPARWLAAHDHDAGDAWKAMPDGAEFAYAGRTYRVVDRTRADYVAGPVALDPLVHGDLTLQTCDGVDELVFLHAALVG